MGSLGRFKPVAAMIGLQFGYAIMNIMIRVSLTGGLSPYVFVTYRQAVASMVLIPVAYFLERKERPALTFPVFCNIFLLSLIGITVNQNFYFKGLYLASSTLAAAMSNLIPAVTFLIAVTIGMEKVDYKSVRGHAKVLGMLICVGGAMLMALYRGPLIGKLWSTNLRSYHLVGSDDVVEDWQMGSLYLLGGCLCWSTWNVLQASTISKYDAPLSLTALMCSLGTLQSALVALVIEQNLDVWTLEWNFDLLCIIYSGTVCSGIAFYIQTWCISKRGPVFVVMFNPLLTVIVTIMAVIILHEKLHLGSIGGGILIVGGLYVVLWGNAKDVELPLHVRQLSSMHLPGLPILVQESTIIEDITEPLLEKESSDLESNT
ncbi:hypothetical protein SUGI_0355630 [Cryptomeria japonica]|uniref:WAT1-related protein At5g07050 n=1 Tax=Cryptomeria japonica TaxID=3369 RepID=UPI002408C757|nr:WAT1-related protein At5g07050 [Cryptomeria japonica]GLJ19635.1 hypothetical protein SUGI_0355630 [Cryptomeria japonica]